MFAHLFFWGGWGCACCFSFAFCLLKVNHSVVLRADNVGPRVQIRRSEHGSSSAVSPAETQRDGRAQPSCLFRQSHFKAKKLEASSGNHPGCCCCCFCSHLHPSAESTHRNNLRVKEAPRKVCYFRGYSEGCSAPPAPHTPPPNHCQSHSSHLRRTEAVTQVCPAPPPCEQTNTPGWRRSLLVWATFSLLCFSLLGSIQPL